MKSETLKKAFKDSLPVMAGYIVLGSGFGIIMQVNGFGILWALAMSVFIYAGSMQYVAVGLLSGGASLVTVAMTTLMVNARHLFYGISMIDRYKNSGAKKPYLIFSLTDETYSIVCHGENTYTYYLAVSALNQLYWVTGTVFGSLLGNVLPFSTEGIDFALTALFITVFTDQWLSSKKHFSSICGVAVSVLCLLIFGKDSFMIPAMITLTVILTVAGSRKKENPDE